MFPNKDYVIGIPPPSTWFLLILVKIFSTKAAIKSTAYGGANFVPIAVARMCL